MCVGRMQVAYLTSFRIKRNPNMDTPEAVAAVVSFETLPPQIDFVAPYQRKADKAYEFIYKLSDVERDECLQAIEEAVNEYYRPHASMQGYSVAELDAMF
jgi:hypothetical protein